VIIFTIGLNIVLKGVNKMKKTKQKQQLVQKVKQKVVYKARKGSPFGIKEAQAVGEEIYSIKERNPQRIVEFAENPSTTLHNLFDWNDDVASEKWRLQQARNIVNHIVEYKIIEGEEQEVKSFFPVVNSQKQNVYVPHQEAITNSNYKKQLLTQMKTQLQNLLKIIGLFSNLE